MKRYIRDVIAESEDWKTDTADSETNAFRQLMIDNAEVQDDPYVGIFWYDTYNSELFGIVKALASDIPYKMTDLFSHKARTCTPLHEKVWRKAQYKKNPDPRFNRDYTKVPRGRVFEVEDEGFVVCIGSWIDDYPEAKDLILDEFELPDTTRFKIDTHWELGHGWS